jgi:GxxExxY protein
MTQQEINNMAYRIVGCAIEVQKELGPGLLENVYEKCLVEELKQNNFNVQTQVKIPVKYKGKEIDANYFGDIIINDIIILELKCVETILPIHKAQLLTYLKLTGKPKGLLINFNSDNITNTLVSLVTENFSKLPK